MTGKDEMDDQVVGALCEQITADVGHVTADKMYDTNAVYQVLDSHSPNAEIVIPPKDNTFADNRHHSKRRSNLIECAAVGIMNWQKRRHYGRRNVSGTAMQRYKKIIGSKLHSRKPKNQSQQRLSIATKPFATEPDFPMSYCLTSCPILATSVLLSQITCF